MVLVLFFILNWSQFFFINIEWGNFWPFWTKNCFS